MVIFACLGPKACVLVASAVTMEKVPVQLFWKLNTVTKCIILP